MRDRWLPGIVALIILIALSWILIALLEHARGEKQQEQLYQGVALDAHLIELDKIALEKAYEQQVLLLFSVWLKDDVSIVHRINNGLKNARRAYAEAAARIQERENQLKQQRK